MLKRCISTVVMAAIGIIAYAQVDTTGIYSDRSDSLEATVFTARREANYLSRNKDLRTEVISSAGLMKMACCNLAESFENSASVTVDYADATTGARQIRLLGLSGIYTQMLDENRPTMRGITAATAAAFKAKPKSKTETVTYVVSMHCKNCVNKITDKISFMKGVKDLKVSLKDKTVTIKYDPAVVQESTLEKTIRDLGYTADKQCPAPEKQ